jgi:hypothetical protein
MNLDPVLNPTGSKIRDKSTKQSILQVFLKIKKKNSKSHWMISIKQRQKDKNPMILLEKSKIQQNF